MSKTNRVPRVIVSRGAVVVAFIALAVALLLSVVIRAYPDRESLRLVIEATVQLLGFGGIILGISYPTHRSLIRSLRRERIEWMRRLARSKHLTKDQENSTESPQPDAEKMILYLQNQILRTVKDYAETQAVFMFSFLLMGGELFLSIFHLVEYDQIQSPANLSAGTLLFGIEIMFLLTGLGGVFFALFKGAILPQEPPTGNWT
jgi:hypothetical protein